MVLSDLHFLFDFQSPTRSTYGLKLLICPALTGATHLAKYLCNKSASDYTILVVQRYLQWPDPNVHSLSNFTHTSH